MRKSQKTITITT